MNCLKSIELTLAVIIVILWSHCTIAYGDDFWPLEAADKFCVHSDFYKYALDIDKNEKIMQCQQNCTARFDCVGIAYTYNPLYDNGCEICLDDTLNDAVTDYGFYRRPDIDECESDPCKHAGTCVDGIDSYTCTCIPGYTGHDCETNIDECESDPCKNGGTCCDGIDSYTCTCFPGFTGHDCETNIDECESDPCQNGGTCCDGIDSYTCTCIPGYTGHDCETNIDECESDPCKNGGTCCDGIDSYTCTCFPGFTGHDCETKETTSTEYPTTEQKTTPSFPTTEHDATTAKTSTTKRATSTTAAPYSCMDITVDQCSDEALDVIDTLPMDTVEDCHTLCDMVFKGTCNSFIYYSESRTCTILEDNFYYLYGCKTVSAGQDTLLNCLQDDVKYPDECKKMIESDCSFHGTVLLNEDGIVDPEECFQLSELMHGQYFVHNADSQNCLVYDGNSRICKVQRGPNGIRPSDCPK